MSHSTAWVRPSSVLFSLLSLAAARSTAPPPLPCDGDWTIRPSAACCEYRVVRAAATELTGTIPRFVNATLYHTVFVTNLSTAPPHVGTVGAMIAIDFSATGPPVVSFRYNEGTAYARLCNTTLPSMFAPSNAVVMTVVNTTDVVVVTGVPQMNRVDAHTLAPLDRPYPFVNTGGFPGPSQTGGDPRVDPTFYGPSHIVADAPVSSGTGSDLYGFVYVYTPIPGYEIYRLAAGTTTRSHFATVAASPQLARTGSPGFSHQALALTKSYVILVEAPCSIPTPGAPFNYATAGAGWLGPSGRVLFRVLDKRTGIEVGNFTSAEPFFSWHHANAWENDTHITMDLTWVPNNRSIGLGMIGELLPYDWEGKLVRVAMPNPANAAANAAGTSTSSENNIVSGGIQSRILSSATWVSPDFPVINPAHATLRPTRYIWMLAVNASMRAAPYLPTVVKLDTTTGLEVTWSYVYDGPPLAPASPMFVPSARDLPADSDEGVLIVLLVGAKNIVVILDAATLVELATFRLPIAPIAAAGLHNFWSDLPASV